jgi:hypothetical protein
MQGALSAAQRAKRTTKGLLWLHAVLVRGPETGCPLLLLPVAAVVAAAVEGAASRLLPPLRIYATICDVAASTAPAASLG